MTSHALETKQEENGHLKRVLEPYQVRIEQNIRDAIHTFGMASKLRDACEYALTMGGKRFRPALVMMMAEGVGLGLDVSGAALAVEYFHTASLIADDLPCMDNDAFRRGKPSVHIVYGEATALLASYALISAGYEAIVKNGSIPVSSEFKSFERRRAEITTMAIENATRNTGVFGATGGQFLDIFPSDVTKEMAREVIHKKTVSLFEISFVLGWLFGGGDPTKLERVKNAAAHFGQAFQIADDFGDVEQDIANDRKINAVTLFGEAEAYTLFQTEVAHFVRSMEALAIQPELLHMLQEMLQKQVQKESG